MKQLSDQELVDRYIRTGDDRYFAQIYTRHYHRVYCKCLAYTSNPADSEDFVQDIFVRLTRKLNGFKGEAKLSTWLHTITVNYCIDQLRKQKHVRTQLQTYGHELVSTSEWTTEPEEEYRLAVEQALGQLTRQQRELLQAKYLEGSPLKDIARQQNLTPDAVKMRIKRARDRARNLYQQIRLTEEYF